MPEPGEVALEALGRLLDVEVGLGGDPLDALAADPEDAVLLALDAEAVAHRLDAVDDDAGRLRRLGQLGRVGQQLGEARRGARRAPRRSSAEIATHGQAVRRAGAPERRPRLARPPAGPSC